MDVSTDKGFSVTVRVEQAILSVPGQRVMLNPHLAALYGVAPRVLMQAVKRNLARFPEDFMFQLTREEFANLKSQIVTSSWGGLRRASPYAFTEQGVSMLSSVLRSPSAIQVNVEIMRAFVRLRRLLASHEDLARQLAELEKRYDAQFRVVFDAIRQLMAPAAPARRSIGFKVEESAAATSPRVNGERRCCRQQRTRPYPPKSG
jgi:ORF6N domain